MKGLAALALAAALVACGGTTTTSTQTPNARPSSPARITILVPSPAQLVHGTSLAVKVELVGGEIVPVASTNLSPTKGHVHVKLDGRILTINAGLDYTVQGLTPGAHLLEAEFVAADHSEFSPPVVSTVTFTDAP